MRRRVFLAGLVAWPGAGLAAGPPRWIVEPARSAIRFGYVLDGERAEGRFTRFSGEGSLAGDAPGAARFGLSIASDSIDLGNPFVSAYATSTEWFDARHYPHVRYRLTGLAPLGGARYKADGEITIKGRTRRAGTVMSLETGAREARARGSFALSREAFMLGTRITDLFVTIGDRVTVEFDLVAHRTG